jgi:hypothetical protein
MARCLVKHKFHIVILSLFCAMFLVQLFLYRSIKCFPGIVSRYFLSYSYNSYSSSGCWYDERFIFHIC